MDASRNARNSKDVINGNNVTPAAVRISATAVAPVIAGKAAIAKCTQQRRKQQGR